MPLAPIALLFGKRLPSWLLNWQLPAPVRSAGRAAAPKVGSAANAPSHALETLFPALRTLRRHQAAEVGAATASPVGDEHPDEALVRACGALRADLNGMAFFAPDDPANWENGPKVVARTTGLVQWIATTRCHTQTGLRAKALALYALLDGGEGSLYPDAAAPDVLAWSLVQDLLVEVPCGEEEG